MQAAGLLARVAEHGGELPVAIAHRTVRVDQHQSVAHVVEERLAAGGLRGKRVEHGVELPPEAADLVVAFGRADAGGEIARRGRAHGAHDARQRRGDPARPPNVEPGQQQGQQQEESAHGGEELQLLALVGRLGKAGEEHADALAVAIMDRCVAGDHGFTENAGARQPDVALLEHVGEHLGLGKAPHRALAAGQAQGGGDAPAVQQQAGLALGAVGQGAGREDDIAHAIDEGLVAAQRESSEENPIHLAGGRCDGCGHRQQQAVFLDAAKARASLPSRGEHAHPRWQARIDRGELVRVKAFEGRGRQALARLAEREAAWQPAAVRPSGGADQHLTLGRGDHEEIQPCSLRPAGEDRRDLLGGARLVEQAPHRPGLGKLAHALLGLAAHVL